MCNCISFLGRGFAQESLGAILQHHSLQGGHKGGGVLRGGKDKRGEDDGVTCVGRV